MIKFIADSVQVRNSKIGDEVSVTFTAGIYEWDSIKDVIKYNGDVMYISVSNKEGKVKDDREENSKEYKNNNS